MGLVVLDVPFGSLEQIQSVGLRYEVLRKPLGLEFSSVELEAEHSEIHIVAMQDQLVCGCMVLKKLPAGSMKMRQVAVKDNLQGQGIGKKMVEFAEQKCRELGVSRIELHARDEAVAFYLQLQYHKVGEPFTEVGIGHFLMEKELS
jgi:N-acetylglutamate synthase-like GNAT family acetyltransferase